MISAGQVLNGEYLVIKHLGSGNNGDVWLGFHIHQQRYYALKISHDHSFEDTQHELVIMQKVDMMKNPPETVTGCCRLYSHFLLKDEDCDGETIERIVLVVDLLGASLQDVLSEGKYKYGFPLDQAKEYTRQIIRSLSSLHACGYIHADFKTDNIMVRELAKPLAQTMAKFDSLSEFYPTLQKDHAYGVCLVADLDDDDEISDENYSEESEDSDGSANYDPNVFNVRRQSIPDLVTQLKQKYNMKPDDEFDFETRINRRGISKDTECPIVLKEGQLIQTCLIDFGNAISLDDEPYVDEIQDRIVRAPESILALDVSQASDIWSLGCVVFEMLTGFELFNPSEAGDKRDLIHLYLIEKLIGAIPHHMKLRSPRARFLFDEKRSWAIAHVLDFVRIDLEYVLIKQHGFSRNDARDAQEFLRHCLQVDPAKRWTCEQLLQHPWLN